MRAAARLAASEIQGFLHGKTRRGAILVMLVIPLLYGGLYLWAFWNPYGNIGRVPVALVDLDRPVRTATGTVDAGGMLAGKLVRGHVLRWVRTSRGQAAAGVADGRFYASLTIPADFSASVASLASRDPEPANLVADINVSENYIASQIMSSVFTSVRQAASADFSTQLLDHIFLQLAGSGQKAKAATAGASRIAGAVARTSSGASRLAAGLSASAAGAGRLDGATAAVSNGAGQLATGLASLQVGLAELAQGSQVLPSSSSALASGASAVAAGARQSSVGIATASSAASELAPGASSLYSALLAYEKTDPLAAVSPIYQRIVQGSHRLSGGLAQVSAGLSRAAPGTQQLAQGAARVSAGAGELASSTPALVRGLDQAAAGSAELAPAAAHLAAGASLASAGATSLDGGIDRLASASSELSSGLGQLDPGAQTLAARLGAAAGDTGSFSAANASTRAALVATPVALSTRDLHPVPDYGTAFAPYFIPLALWVGCLMLFFLLRPLSRRAMTLGTRPAVVAAGGLLPVAVLAILQAVLVLVVVEAGLGLRAVHPETLAAFTLMSAVVFAAVIQMLEAVLGSVGRVVALAMLILQLVSSAGTYPIQTSPSFIRWVQPLLPMTYMVKGMRDAVSGSIGYIGHDVVVLLLWLLVAGALTTLAAARGRTLTYKVIRPELDMSVT